MTQAQLVAELKQGGYLRTPVIIRAFQSIDRVDFVPAELCREAYFNGPLPIGQGQTISQPLTVAFMLERLQAQKGERILDVGSGSGWTTALLAKLVGKKGKVFGVERVPELVEFGRSNLAKYHLPQAKIVAAGRRLGLQAEAPFDRILVSATAKTLPVELAGQLKEGGRMVLPIGSSVWQIDKLANGELKRQEFSGFVFVPLVTK